MLRKKNLERENIIIIIRNEAQNYEKEKAVELLRKIREQTMMVFFKKERNMKKIRNFLGGLFVRQRLKYK